MPRESLAKQIARKLAPADLSLAIWECVKAEMGAMMGKDAKAVRKIRRFRRQLETEQQKADAAQDADG